MRASMPRWCMNSGTLEWWLALIEIVASGRCRALIFSGVIWGLSQMLVILIGKASQGLANADRRLVAKIGARRLV